MWFKTTKTRYLFEKQYFCENDSYLLLKLISLFCGLENVLITDSGEITSKTRKTPSCSHLCSVSDMVDETTPRQKSRGERNSMTCVPEDVIY